MKKRIRVLAVVGAAGTVVGLTSGAASASTRPTWFSGGQHSCSYTNPEYMLSDWDMLVHTQPGTTKFTASHTNARPGRYEDAYWVTGWHDENSSICDKRTVVGTGGGKSTSLQPGTVGGATVTANFSAHGSSSSARLGFDLWLTAGTSEHTPTAMEHDRRTWEVLIQPGRGSLRDNPGWHRDFIGIGGHAGAMTVWGLNLTRLVEQAGVPRGYHWAAIDAGGETPRGSFSVTTYYLHINGQHPVVTKHGKKAVKKVAKPKPEPNTVKVPNLRGLRAVTAVARLHAAGLGDRIKYLKGKWLIITKTSPAAGQYVKRGTRITLYYKVQR